MGAAWTLEWTPVLGGWQAGTHSGEEKHTHTRTHIHVHTHTHAAESLPLALR